ncbi:MAG: hypothetical protein LBB87_01870, partial [Nitrososphaerota archaeon]|nr:hypothetical protein [Nitrososphaerota archaeon]
MLKNLRVIGMFMIGLFIFSSLCTVCSVKVVSGVEGFSAKEKLPALLSDVIGLDLSKYTITEERYKPRYEYGGAVEVEYCGFTLIDKNDGEISVMSEFYNGIPEWVLISPSTGSLYYAMEPPKNSVEKMENILERYMTFAQKYDIATLDTSLAFDLLSKAPDSLPAHGTYATVSLDDMTLSITQNSFGFAYTADGAVALNKSWCIDFADKISFHDTFGLYSVCDVNVLSSEEEFTSFAFVLAQKFCDDHLFYQIGADGVEVEV